MDPDYVFGQFVIRWIVLVMVNETVKIVAVRRSYKTVR